MLYVKKEELKDINTLLSLLKEGYNYITEMGYAVKNSKSTDDKSIITLLCGCERVIK